MRTLVPLVVLVLGMAGCATHHVARAKSFPSGVLDGRRSSESIALSNAQTDTDFVEVGQAGMGRSLHGNLAQWTDAAIDLLEEKLTDSGMTVSEGAAKKLTLAITDAKMSITGGGWGFKCAVTLRSETSDGWKTDYVGERGSSKFARVCDAGIAEAVANLLRDERMQEYLGF